MSEQTGQHRLPDPPARSVEDYEGAIAAVNDEIMAAIEGCTDEQWQRVTASEQWPVGVVAHHTGAVQKAFARVLGALETGAPVPQFSAEDVEASNARHAQEFAAVDKPETRAFVRTNGAALVDATSRLTDERLNQVAGTFGGYELTVAQLLEFAVIAHLNEHLASIRATIANQA